MQHKALYLLNSSVFDQIYGPEERAEIAALVDVYAPPQTSESIRSDSTVLQEAEIILSGWGMPLVDVEFLAQAPQLRAIFYGAGSVRGFVTEQLWQRGVIVTSSYAANAVPVAEYALAVTLFSLKHGWGFMQAIRREGKFPPRTAAPGAYGSTVGIISLGMVGRLVIERLRAFDLRLIAYDPFVTPAEAAALGVTLVSLEQLFREADVASLHTPWLPETVGMITGTHLASMQHGATFINTARGAVVREEEMIAVLQRRPDLQAVLDVTYPEPPVPGSPLYSLPNVVLTPHIAGSRDAECRRMGRYAIDDLRRYLAGEPLQWQISKERAALLA